MTDINKKELSETDICDQFITPAILHAGWEMGRQGQQGLSCVVVLEDRCASLLNF